MNRFFFFSFFFFAGQVSLAQNFRSDHSTPLIESSPCHCSSWHSSFVAVDSSRKRLKETGYQAAGKNIKRIYFITKIDSSWNDVCDIPGNCSGLIRTRTTSAYRTWFTDEVECGLLSFSLPATSEKRIVLSEVATVVYNGSCQPVFSPNVLEIPLHKPADTVNASVTINGKTLQTSIVMINPALNVTAREAPQLTTLLQVNDRLSKAYLPVLLKANAAIERSLRVLGQWKGEERTKFNLLADAVRINCSQPHAATTVSYRIAGEGQAGIAGRLTLPAEHIPVMGSFFGKAPIALPITISTALQVNEETTCMLPHLSSSTRGLVVGRQPFDLRSQGVTVTGTIEISGGSLNTDVTFLPEVEVKAATLQPGEIKVKATIEDKWGWATWNVEYSLWKGVTFKIPVGH